MSYRCSICDSAAPRNQKLLRHVVTRRSGATVKTAGRVEVARELPICQSCDAEMRRLRADGVPPDDVLEILTEMHARDRKVLAAFPS